MPDEFGEVLYSFKKNATEIVGAGFSSFKGKDYFYLRVFTPSVEDPEAFVPTDKGLSLSVDLLEPVKEGLLQLNEVMSNEKVVKRIPKAKDEECWIGVKPIKDNTYVYIQVYHKFGTEFSHTKKAVFVALNKHDELKNMIQTLIDARSTKK